MEEKENFCPRCGKTGKKMVESPCLEAPENLVGIPLGQYHCPDCGIMLLAGFEHPRVCILCATEIQLEMREIKFNGLREDLAEYAHDAWSGWMRYLFDKSVLNDDGSVTIPKNYVDRWVRQMNTAYKDLPENEKNSDRKEADRMIKIFTKAR